MDKLEIRSKVFLFVAYLGGMKRGHAYSPQDKEIFCKHNKYFLRGRLYEKS